ncbi:hypothetical protein GP486_003552 [Trichoglossum hirsutum]|uniref:PH domain-containing protein n=1 Tax=Trichoglossum hirsutum TaxID=265104 RepID=A0A9P8LCU6_9PEZI|nr:hypothetical protein GP486_003552 [Trichoglossum hirsutum]
MNVEGQPLGLETESYTAYRLNTYISRVAVCKFHAPEESKAITLTLTSTRFVGPIPAGWLNSSRQSWYKRQLRLDNYSSRAATFRADADTSSQRRLTGLGDGPSISARHGRSFPQPEDIADGEACDTESDGGSTVGVSPAIPALRSTEADEDNGEDIDLAFNSDGEPSVTSLERVSPAVQGRPRTKSSGRSQGDSSFVTAKETLSSLDDTKPSRAALPGREIPQEEDHLWVETRAGNVSGSPLLLSTSGTSGRISSNSSEALSPSVGASNSMASLLHRDHERRLKNPKQDGHSHSSSDPPKGILSKGKRAPSRGPEPAEDSRTTPSATAKKDRISSGLVRFNVPDDVIHRDHQMKLRLEQLSRRRSLRQHRHDKVRDGEILKMDRMLVRVESTSQPLPDNFDENKSMKLVTKLIKKWREFLVVCRETSCEDAEILLQFYNSRVIPAVEHTTIKQRSTHLVHLNRKNTRVNLYSPLDKTVVVWVPYKRGTLIYIMRPRSAANAVEWYTFLRSSLGWNRAQELQVNVPDLNVSLVLRDVFEKVEMECDAAKASEDGDESAIIRTMVEEQAVAPSIIRRCMVMLQDFPEWSEVLKNWTESEKMGLAWKRYDRLEWIHGAHEQKMYGTMAMEQSHDLELRPKMHYPTSSEMEDGQVMIEPTPVEGFLIRLTTQTGREERFGKLFSKRLYFSTHNQFLCFCKPAKAHPPRPPKTPIRQVAANQVPLIYSIAPYLVKNGNIAWFELAATQAKRRHDQDAYDEAERKVNTLLCSDGYIDLCEVSDIRSATRRDTAASPSIRVADQVGDHAEVADTHHEVGGAQEIDDSQTFELVLRNGLIAKFQAYNQIAKNEWIKRLKDLVKYWKSRIASDTELLKATRRANLKLFHIDEEMESVLGQFAEKWEVSRSIASPELYNMCGICSCRTINVAGILYRKPMRRSTFRRNGVILCHGQLLIFRSALRSYSGKVVPQIHYERESAIDLNECYIYSGLVTENDLLYQNQTFDSNNPSRHALPRIYREDGWTSSDEDTMTCFVVWQPKQKSFFRATEQLEEGKHRRSLKRVSQLGVPGRSIVFKTRSRAERDHWVMSISMEIERLQKVEEVRVVSK